MSTIMAFTCPSLFYKYSMQGEEEKHSKCKTRKLRENERREEKRRRKKNKKKDFFSQKIFFKKLRVISECIWDRGVSCELVKFLWLIIKDL